MADILKVIGQNIKAYRKQRGLSQEALAHLAGVHRTYMGAVERGERNVSAQNIAKIADALGMEPHLLLKRKRT